MVEPGSAQALATKGCLFKDPREELRGTSREKKTILDMSP